MTSVCLCLLHFSVVQPRCQEDAIVLCTVRLVRWDRLWADLEARAAALERDELEAEVADREVRERATVSLMDRVRGSVGATVTCEVAGDRRWRGALVGAGPDWLAIRQDDPALEQTVLVPRWAVRRLDGLSPTAVPAAALGLVAARLDLRHVLRRLATADVTVVAHRVDGVTVPGRCALVGRDYLEVSDEGGGRLTMPLEVLAAVVV